MWRVFGKLYQEKLVAGDALHWADEQRRQCQTPAPHIGFQLGQVRCKRRVAVRTPRFLEPLARDSKLGKVLIVRPTQPRIGSRVDGRKRSKQIT